MPLTSAYWPVPFTLVVLSVAISMLLACTKSWRLSFPAAHSPIYARQLGERLGTGRHTTPSHQYAPSGDRWADGGDWNEASIQFWPSHQSRRSGERFSAASESAVA